LADKKLCDDFVGKGKGKIETLETFPLIKRERESEGERETIKSTKKNPGKTE
jgi:hypothetical protein